MMMDRASSSVSSSSMTLAKRKRSSKVRSFNCFGFSIGFNRHFSFHYRQQNVPFQDRNSLKEKIKTGYAGDAPKEIRRSNAA